ncbi:MAG: hypothetical protein KKE76_05875 [Gammaproteobacteria bacterium]|nr:hypothetical protein [Gammaproteobacteria bacterium]
MKLDLHSRHSTVSDTSRPRSRLRTLLPLLVFAAILIAVAGREFPAVSALLQRWTDPAAWQAGQVCQQAALELAKQSDYARIVETGKVHNTQKGFYVEDIEVGEMDDQGGELQFLVSCYVDTAGRVVRADRLGR